MPWRRPTSQLGLRHLVNRPLLVSDGCWFQERDLAVDAINTARAEANSARDSAYRLGLQLNALKQVSVCHLLGTCWHGSSRVPTLPLIKMISNACPPQSSRHVDRDPACRAHGLCMS